MRSSTPSIGEIARRRVDEMDAQIDDVAASLKTISEEAVRNKFGSLLDIVKLKRERVRTMRGIARMKRLQAELDVLLVGAEVVGELRALKRRRDGEDETQEGSGLSSRWHGGTMYTSSPKRSQKEATSRNSTEKSDKEVTRENPKRPQKEVLKLTSPKKSQKVDIRLSGPKRSHLENNRLMSPEKTQKEETRLAPAKRKLDLVVGTVSAKRRKEDDPKTAQKVEAESSSRKKIQKDAAKPEDVAKIATKGPKDDAKLSTIRTPMDDKDVTKRSKDGAKSNTKGTPMDIGKFAAKNEAKHAKKTQKDFAKDATKALKDGKKSATKETPMDVVRGKTKGAKHAEVATKLSKDQAKGATKENDAESSTKTAKNQAEGVTKETQKDTKKISSKLPLDVPKSKPSVFRQRKNKSQEKQTTQHTKSDTQKDFKRTSKSQGTAINPTEVASCSQSDTIVKTTNTLFKEIMDNKLNEMKVKEEFDCISSIATLIIDTGAWDDCN